MIKAQSTDRVDPWSNPKEGMKAQIIENEQRYYDRTEDAGLMPIHSHGAEGVLGDIDGETAELKNDDGTAWVPLNVLKGYDPKASQAVATTTTSMIDTTFLATTTTSWYEGDGYMSVGCRRISNEQAIGVYHDELAMTLNKCYLQCKERSNAKYFGVTDGTVCFCARIPPGDKIAGEHCDIKCGGQPKDKCGGVGQAASTYTMIDCQPKSPEDEAADKSEEEANLKNQYGSWEGESCGWDPDNKAELDGSSKLSGSVDECKLACWNSEGADTCHGFTYDTTLSLCTFHVDVAAGERKKKNDLSCYYKTVGFKPLA